MKMSLQILRPLVKALHSWRARIPLCLGLLVFILAACRTGPGPDGTIGEGKEFGTASLGTITVTPPKSAPTLTPDQTEPPPVPLSPTPSPGLEFAPVNPTKLPEPHLIQVIDWEQVFQASGPLCADCGVDQVRVTAPRGLGIAVIQVFSEGVQDDTARVDTDLRFSEGVVCLATGEGGLCGLIFGQVRGDEIIIKAQSIAGGQHRLRYAITFQHWADYSSP